MKDKEKTMARNWTPESWRGLPILQVPDYPDWIQGIPDCKRRDHMFHPKINHWPGVPDWLPDYPDWLVVKSDVYIT